MSGRQWLTEHSDLARVFVTTSATYSASIFVIMAFVARAASPLTGNALLLLKGVWLVSLIVPFAGMGAISGKNTLLLTASIGAMLIVLGSTFAVVFIWI